MSDDYLWDPKGKPDPEIEKLEKALRPLTHVDRAFEADASEDAKDGKDGTAPIPISAARGKKRWTLGRWVMLAAAAALGAGGVWMAVRAQKPLENQPIARTVEVPKSSAPEEPPAIEALPARPGKFAVERIAGEPTCGSSPIAGTGELAVGQWLETDSGSEARITVAEIGRVDVGRGSRVKLTATGPDQHRLDLERGSISAVVNAPPRLFVVGTPAATAVDLGCAYTLEVDEKGAGKLHVTSGWVSFEDKGRASIVAAGATCHTRPGRGPGTPSYDDAAAKIREALARFDFADGGEKAVGEVLAGARPRDALTVWHLIARVEGEGRRRVVDRLKVLSPPPAEAPEGAVMKLDRIALARWRDAIVQRDGAITW